MKEIVVLSGKGGTGKTSIVGSLAAIAHKKVLADCDVDAADLHLLLSPTIKRSSEFWSGQVAQIDATKCTGCGICEDACRFNAIVDFTVDPLSCEGCGLCYHVCPDDAITMNERLSGHWFVSETRYGPLVHARMGIGEENSGKLVAVVKQNAKEIADREALEYVIVDGPPGIGCPVISSLSGANLALIVTEPTLSGIHDLERVLGVCRHFGVQPLVCINKCDINPDNCVEIERFCSGQGVEIISRIPLDHAVTEALVRGVPVVEYSRNGVSLEIVRMWEDISGRLAD